MNKNNYEYKLLNSKIMTILDLINKSEPINEMNVLIISITSDMLE